jgi:dTDP-4-amino-4,6-dideoxygalactose transaminase
MSSRPAGGENVHAYAGERSRNGQGISVSLPIYPRMTDGHVDDVIAAIRDLVTQGRRSCS